MVLLVRDSFCGYFLRHLSIAFDTGHGRVWDELIKGRDNIHVLWGAKANRAIVPGITVLSSGHDPVQLIGRVVANVKIAIPTVVGGVQFASGVPDEVAAQLIEVANTALARWFVTARPGVRRAQRAARLPLAAR